MKMYECQGCGSDFNIDKLSACPNCRTEVAFNPDGSLTGIRKPCRRCGKIFSAQYDRQVFCKPTYCGANVETRINHEEWLLLCKEVGYGPGVEPSPRSSVSWTNLRSSVYLNGVRKNFYDTYFGPWAIFLLTTIPSAIYIVNDSSSTNRWANVSYGFGLLGSIFIGVALFNRWESEKFLVTAAVICFFLSFAVLSQEDTRANYSGYDVRATCINDQDQTRDWQGRDGPITSETTNFDIFLISTGLFTKYGHYECPSFTYTEFDGNIVTIGNYDPLDFLSPNNSFRIGSKAFFSQSSIAPTRWNRNLNLGYTMGVLLCLTYYVRCRKRWAPVDDLENPEFHEIPPIETRSEVIAENSSTLERLERLADLRKQGFLTPEEFEFEKSKILRGPDY